MVREERATFHELHLKFREFLPNRESNHFRMSVKRNDVGAVVIKETREFITMPFEFEIGDGTCFGSSRAVLLKR